MPQVSSVRNKQKREALLQQANALLADMTEAPAKKGKKKIQDEEPESGLTELTDNAPPSGGLSIHLPKLKPKREKLNYRINKKGKLALAFKAKPGKVNKPKKKAQVDERELMLAGCTVQRFAGGRYRQTTPCDLSHISPTPVCHLIY
jgi:hypothetical protein